MGGIALIPNGLSKGIIGLLAFAQRTLSICSVENAIEHDRTLSHRDRSLCEQLSPVRCQVFDERDCAACAGIGPHTKQGACPLTRLGKRLCGEEPGGDFPDQSTSTKWVGTACCNQCIVE